MSQRSPFHLPEREPGAAFTPADMLRDKRVFVDTGLAPIVFIVVNVFAGLNVAAVAAGVVAVGLMVERLLRRASPVNAIGGLFGTAIAILIALKTGTPEGFFWPKVVQNAAYGLVFLISVAVRRPLVGVAIGAIYQWPSGYVRDPRVRPAFMVASLGWVALFGIRALVYTAFILAGKAEALAAVVLVLGFPAFAGTVFFSYRFVTWWWSRPGVPRPDEFKAERASAAAPAAGPV